MGDDVEESLVAQVRRQMGTAVASLGVLPGSVGRQEPGWWMALGGLPSPDVNMVLVHEDDAAALAEGLGAIEVAQLPAIVMLAGEGGRLADRLPESWQGVGSMPIMSRPLDASLPTADPRVRRATPADAEAVTGLIAEAFGMGIPEAALMTDATFLEGCVLQAWLLEDDGVPVSTVTTGLVEETLTLWCMATPERFARRGYGAAVLRSVLAEAAAAGATLGALGATPAGYPLYAATGWETIEEWALFTNAVSAQFH